MEHQKLEAPLVGDHLALDLLNTQARDNNEAVDFWADGNDVAGWLARQGIVPAAGDKVDGARLLAGATALRALARTLIVRHRDGKKVELAGLNAYLHAYLSAPELARDAEGRMVLTRTARGDTVASLLGPVAEAVAQLLVEGDVELIRQCEHPDCILWFYDRTRSHKRRWCSMARCGNRYKAAQFRKKNSG